jgi:hypothetical protein
VLETAGAGGVARGEVRGGDALSAVSKPSSSDCFFRFAMMAASCGSIARDWNTRWRRVCVRAARVSSNSRVVESFLPSKIYKN